MDYSKVDDETKKLLGELIENIRTEFNRLIKIEYMGIDYNYGLMNFLLKNILAARDARIAELERDVERLDYIENNFHCLGFTQGNKWMTLHQYNDPRYKEFSSLREAVDYATTQQPEGEG